MQIKKISKKRGMASLAIMMVLGMMTLAIVVSITSVVFNQLAMSQGSAQSSGALFYAESGGRDALIRIARNKNYTCASVDCYSMDFATNGCSLATGCAKVSVSTGLGTTTDPKIITSKGINGVSVRTMQISVLLDNGSTDTALQYGKVTSAVWTEITN